MDHATTSHEPTPSLDDQPRSGKLGRWLILGGTVIFVAFVGVRVKASLEKKAVIAAEAQAQAAKATQGPVVKPTELVTGVVESWTPSFRLDGTLNPLRAVDLAFKTGGRLGTIRVARGDRVQQGALLAALDVVEARAQAEQAEAQVAAAEAQHALARDAEDRMTKVADKGVMSQQSLVQARAQVALAAAQVAAAKAQAKLAQANVDNHTLIAPFRGLVVRAPNATGGIVAPGVPMFRVEDTDTLQLDGTLGAEEATLVGPGAPVDIEIEGRTLRAKLTLVLGSLDQATRRVAVAAEFANDPKAPVRPGAFVRARVNGSTPIEVVRLPASALRPGSQDVVLVAEGGVLRERRVVFVLAPDGDLLVRRGITLADRVVRAPSAEHKDGDPVIAALETK